MRHGNLLNIVTSLYVYIFSSHHSGHSDGRRLLFLPESAVRETKLVYHITTQIGDV